MILHPTLICRRPFQELVSVLNLICIRTHFEVWELVHDVYWDGWFPSRYNLASSMSCVTGEGAHTMHILYHFDQFGRHAPRTWVVWPKLKPWPVAQGALGGCVRAPGARAASGAYHIRQVTPLAELNEMVQYVEENRLPRERILDNVPYWVGVLSVQIYYLSVNALLSAKLQGSILVFTK